MQLGRKKLALMYAIAMIFLASCVAHEPPPTPPLSPATTSISPTPTTTPSTPTPIVTPLTSPTPGESIIPSPTTTSSSVPATQISTENATFLSETYPDNSIIDPGETFTKVFELKNSGTSTWTTGYELTLISEETLGSPAHIPLKHEVAPGGKTSISIPLTAPSNPGTYTVEWSLHNERGKTILVDGYQKIWAKVRVCDPDNPCTPSTSATGSITTHGISATLNNFRSDSQTATVNFCMSIPSPYYTLDTAPSLLVDGKAVSFLNGGGDASGCYSFTYAVSAAQVSRASHITLSIDGALRMAPPPGDPNAACNTAHSDLVTKYPGLDFQCQFSMAGYYTELKLPSGMTREEADRLITDAIEGAIYGPWKLTIK